MKRSYWIIVIVAFAYVTFLLVRYGNERIINLVLAFGTWALVIVTWFLVDKTKKQIEENTRNTKEMIKENALLSWRTNIITTLAEYLGIIDFLNEPKKIDFNEQYIQEMRKNLYCMNNKIVLLLGENNVEIKEDMKKLLDNGMNIFSIRNDPEKSNEKQILQDEGIEIKRALMSKIYKIGGENANNP